MTLDEMIAIIQAAKEGRPIQGRSREEGESGIWYDLSEPYWNFDRTDYRIKPEPQRLWVNYYNQESDQYHQDGWAVFLTEQEAKRDCSAYKTVEFVEVTKP